MIKSSQKNLMSSHIHMYNIEQEMNMIEYNFLYLRISLYSRCFTGRREWREGPGVVNPAFSQNFQKNDTCI